MDMEYLERKQKEAIENFEKYMEEMKRKSDEYFEE